jgi:sugar phosphate isomerase/epimerase
MTSINRRRFIASAGLLTGAAILGGNLPAFAGVDPKKKKMKISGHIWSYASKFPPDYDCTPVIEQAFSDFSYAGMDGMELMEVNLRHPDAVANLSALAAKYKVPVTGSSYGAAFWNRDKHQEIEDDVAAIIEKLHQLKASTFGVSVGDAGRIKTETELDNQAMLLRKLIVICDKAGVTLNLHNHTYEVRNNLQDLKGTLSRIPGIKLGPDLNWLVRTGVDPVWFINTYGEQMVYMHIRDQGADGKWTESVGTGVTDFKAIAQALDKVNFKGRVAIELAFDNPPVNPLKEDWKNSLHFVKETFGWS